MILTRQEVETYKKCWENLQDCDDCPMNTNDGRCVITGSRLAETILHYISEAEYWQEKFEIVTSDMGPVKEAENK